MRTRILAVLAALLFGLSVAGAAPATAAPGTIQFHTLFDSQTYLTVKWQNQLSGVVYNAPVNRGEIAGEGSGGRYGTSEPLSFFCGTGWRCQFRVNGGTWSGIITGSDARPWVGVHPGPGYGGKWHVDAKAFR